MWDCNAMKPLKVFDVPGAPLEMPVGVGETHDNWAVTTTALTSKIWLIKQDGNGEWQAKEVADIGDPAKIPLPVDISIGRRRQGLWVNTFMDGKARYCTTFPTHAPKEIYRSTSAAGQHGVAELGRQARVFHRRRCWPTGTRSRVRWRSAVLQDAYNWDGKELKEAFAVDFVAEKLGLAHQMTLNARSMYAGRQSPVPPQADAAGGGDTLAASLGR
jgi:methanethiol oxidase